MKIGIGIDTGGTYTDAVVYHFESKAILGTAKALTTKNDLSIGIVGAIDGLPAELVRHADMISLSTTLATNACVEDKGGQAKLIFFGGDRKVIDAHGGKYGLPPSEDMIIQESFTRFSGKIDREPDWEQFGRRLEEGFEQWDGVGIIEKNAMRNGAVVEKKAKAIFQKKLDIPVVCGHELFSELNCLQRGSSTLLNAGLFPVIQEFLTAVKKALALRHINGALVILRSDGSMMSEEFASLRPMETLLCGPAASAVGGARLTDSPNRIIVDMGGTTTDIALVKNGVPVTVTEGASVGKWKIFLDCLYVKTFGLGGDSAIHYHGRKPCLEEYRVTPLCVAAQKYPAVLENLQKLDKRLHTHYLYEHYMLVKDIGGSARYTEAEKAFCGALKAKPLLIAEAAEAVGRDIYTLHVSRLVKDGVVQVCGLTPTDVMHVKGDFSRYCSEASLLGAEFAAHNMGLSVRDLCDWTYDEVKRKLYIHIVQALLENSDAGYLKNGVGKEIERLILQNYERVKSGNRSHLLSMAFGTEYALVGIGAPIPLFLEDVAQMLGAHSVIPTHHEVANALGAIAGGVSASHSVEIRPCNAAEGVLGYTVFGNHENLFFNTMEEAVYCAVSEAKEGAEAEAARRGAAGTLAVTSDIRRHEAEARNGAVYLGTTVTARAVGTMGF